MRVAHFSENWGACEYTPGRENDTGGVKWYQQCLGCPFQGVYGRQAACLTKIHYRGRVVIPCGPPTGYPSPQSTVFTKNIQKKNVALQVRGTPGCGGGPRRGSVRAPHALGEVEVEKNRVILGGTVNLL